MCLRLPLILSALLALAVPGFAVGEEADPADLPDPPGRVARLSVIQGEVSFQAEDAPAPEPAEINRPVTIGDRVMTGQGSRAELSLGIAAIRVDERTDLSVANLDDEIAQFEVNSGNISVHLRELAEGETFEIDTPNATIRLMRPGNYRVDVPADGSTQLAVRLGEAEIDSGSGPIRVRDQQQARLGRDDQFASIVVLGAPDAFDEWSMDREREISASESSRYVSREVVGYEDLDRYGSWYSEPDYGYVWVPRTVVVGWAPYTFGHWVWIGPWGWTWVDRAPWGFAPFHYGRWAYLRNRWCWVPGPRHRRPIYAPAHVHWTDRKFEGSHWRNDRPRGWIPLGPREVYVPRHRTSPRYLRNVNISNTIIDDNTRITNSFRNRIRDPRLVNRDAPGVRSPPNRGRGNGSDWRDHDRRSGWRDGREDSGRSGWRDSDARSGWRDNGSIWRDGDGRSGWRDNGSIWRDGDGRSGWRDNGSIWRDAPPGSANSANDNERWRTGPGWRTGPNARPQNGPAEDRPGGSFRSGDSRREFDWRGRTDDRRMTIPRTSPDRRVIPSPGDSRRFDSERGYRIPTVPNRNSSQSHGGYRDNHSGSWRGGSVHRTVPSPPPRSAPPPPRVETPRPQPRFNSSGGAARGMRNGRSDPIGARR